MINRIRTFFDSIWLKLRHPSVTFCGWVSVPFSADIRIKGKGHIDFGRKVFLEKRVSISAIDGTVAVGDFTSINRNCIIVAHNSIKIGNNVAIGPNVCIYDHDHAWNKDGIINGKYKGAPIEIGNDCWIGANAIILAGAMIDKCSIIGAGTIVKGEIPDYSIVYDHRNKHIKRLQ